MAWRRNLRVLVGVCFDLDVIYGGLPWETSATLSM